MMERRDFLKVSAGFGAWALMRMSGLTAVGSAEAGEQFISLPPLPYDKKALEPYISARTLEFHYGKHHQGYVKKINRFIMGSRYQHMALEDIIKSTCGLENKKSIYNNAAQVFNHTFFWKSMKPDGGAQPSGRIADEIRRSFGSYDNFTTQFKNAATTQFGSGWAWLVQDGRRLKVIKTANADTPLAFGMKPLLTLDVWEHAYYLDYQNRRGDYVDAWLEHLVNWDFAEKNYEKQ